MANKKTSHYYVLVFTEEGPVYVTSVNYADKVAYWDKKGFPLEMTKSSASELAACLSLNFHSAVAVVSPYELECQPYYYSSGKFTWVASDSSESEEK